MYKKKFLRGIHVALKILNYDELVLNGDFNRLSCAK